MLDKKYTLEYYASLLEIKDDFKMNDFIVIDNINSYRNKYKIYFYYENIQYSFIYLPYIQKILNEYYNFNSYNILHPYIQVFILRNNISLLNQCILKYKLPYELMDTFNIIYSFEDDMTKSFIEWLKHLSTFNFIKMLSYKCKGYLSNQEIDFMMNREYFYIEDYQNEMNLSYESARLKLNKLVKINIIQRHKIGKKYIFKYD